MNVLFDINHPAHVHVFKNAINRLSSLGHNILVTSRDKEIATELLDFTGVKHVVLSKAGSNSNGSFLKELIIKDWRLYRAARRFGADIMVSVAGTFISHVSLCTGIPSLALYDTEDAKLQNLITYPFISKLCVPQCYSGWTPKNKTLRYSGYHELAYLSPDYFSVDASVARENGVVDGRNTFIRLVSWQASHDVGYSGWNEESLDKLIEFLGSLGNVIISSERELPSKYNQYLYHGEVGSVHHVLGACDLYVGESATMASEAAVLGVPSVYVSDAYRSYMNDMQDRYELVKVIETFDLEKIIETVDKYLNMKAAELNKRREALLSDSVDVTNLICSQIEELSREG